MMSTVKSVGYGAGGSALIVGSYVPMGIGQAFLWVGGKFMSVADAMASTGTRWKLYSQALVDVESGKITAAAIQERMSTNGGDKMKAVIELYAALHAEGGDAEKSGAVVSAPPVVKDDLPEEMGEKKIAAEQEAAKTAGTASSIFKKVDLSSVGADAAAAAEAAATA